MAMAYEIMKWSNDSSNEMAAMKINDSIGVQWYQMTKKETNQWNSNNIEMRMA